MKITTTLESYEWTIEFVDKDDKELGGKNDGLALYNDMKILIRNDLNPIMTKQVLVHELTHAILCLQRRWGQKKFDVEELCEFTSFCAWKILKVAEDVMKTYWGSLND